MLSRHLAATLLAASLSLAPAAAQQAPGAGRCADTTKRLDRELGALSERLARQADVPGKLRSGPATLALAELMDMEALLEHLRCLGFGADDRG